MNFQDAHLVYGWGMLICFFGILLNLGMYKKRGRSAVAMATAFLVFGITLGLLYENGPMILVYLLGAIVLGILVYDASLRVGKPGVRR